MKVPLGALLDEERVTAIQVTGVWSIRIGQLKDKGKKGGIRHEKYS